MMQRPSTPLVETPVLHLVIPPFYGGCEGLAMLNRTNLTLSALALSNRLNLGTRSLAANAGVINVGETLRIRPAHHDVMRVGTVWSVVSSIPKSRYAIPPIPSSLSPLQLRQLALVISQQRGLAVDVRVESAARPASLVARPEPCVDDRDREFRTIVPTPGQTSTYGNGSPPARFEIAADRRF